MWIRLTPSSLNALLLTGKRSPIPKQQAPSKLLVDLPTAWSDSHFSGSLVCVRHVRSKLCRGTGLDRRGDEHHHRCGRCRADFQSMRQPRSLSLSSISRFSTRPRTLSQLKSLRHALAYSDQHMRHKTGAKVRGLKDEAHVTISSLALFTCAEIFRGALSSIFKLGHHTAASPFHAASFASADHRIDLSAHLIFSPNICTATHTATSTADRIGRCNTNRGIYSSTFKLSRYTAVSAIHPASFAAAT